ncbi:DUF4199 domain-containing protein [Flavivirga spongiicola]|uniref:DUF4199 domain-containing protein n=1 Tax=Flavivirga spongiicola TaxID=421621 RepID=A0ABU7XS38_9FLAO|nr:DUF4199 domain-containing protein [Flavivirga sp. MEBiC05379]MDO5977729.1 DUF4199 domain-containing protein [Flavivirga sp. MEBiC05379]
MEKSLKSIAINHGLYLGIALSLFTLIGYAINLGLLVNYWVMLLILPLSIIIFGIISTSKIKGKFDGFLSFKEAFSSFFITVAIGVIVSTLVSIIIFNFIDPDAAIETKEILITNTENFMRGMNAPLEAIAESVEQIENQDTFSLGAQFKSLAQSLVFFAIIGLIVAAVMKKNNPDTE